MPNINTEQVRQSLAMASDDVLLSMWKQVSKDGVQNLDYDIVKAFADEISERGLSHRLNERSENKMKITKRQLKQIIKEEKAKLVSEANPDGTISDDEEELEEQLMTEALTELDNIIATVREEAIRIGGPFRGPGMKIRIFMEMQDMIGKAG